MIREALEGLFDRTLEDMTEVREIARYAVKIHLETSYPIEEITRYEMNLTASERRLVNREAERQLTRITQ
jgi:hypothetical protein